MICSDPETVLAAATAVTVHELGHLAAMRMLSVKGNTLALSACGMSISYDDRKTTYLTDIIIAISGGAANLILFLLCRTGGDSYYIDALCVFNIFLCAFNMLPVKALDGGRALYALLSYLFSPDTADRVTEFTGRITAFGLIISGVVLFIVSGYNFTVLITAFWLLRVVNGDNIV